MNGYELIMKLQQKMQTDSSFAAQFNSKVAQLNRMPGLQKEVFRIAQIQDERKRQQAINRLPDNVKKIVNDLFKLINS